MELSLLLCYIVLWKLIIMDLMLLYWTGIPNVILYCFVVHMAWTINMVNRNQHETKHWATKMVRCLRDLPYEDRLQLPTMKYRHYRGDTIQVYKYIYLHGLHKVQSSILCTHHKATREHALKLDKRPAEHRLCQSFFTQRVVHVWNSLPNSIGTPEVLLSHDLIEQLIGKTIWSTRG